MAFCPCHNDGRLSYNRRVSKNGTVASADLPLIAQCMPGKSKIRFRQMTVAKAQNKFRSLMDGLNRIVEDE
jgi:allophanate hydrolase subunit 2